MVAEDRADEVDDPSFRKKLTKFARIAGRGVVERALVLYHCLRDPDTPKWAKSAIGGALAYFVLPIDAIPDLAPFIGYGDDLTALAAVLAAVAFYVKDDHRERARRALARWFD